jgi:PAS domain S-box-containing protein
MFGMTEEEICHAGRNGLVDLDDPNLPKFSDEREKTGKAKGELRFKRKDGSIFPAEISSALFTNSKGETRNSLIIRDISERKKAENEIKRKVDELQKTRQASLKLIEDLTEEIEKRKQYEKELKQSESRFAIAFNASPAPLVISEIDTGIFINVNNRWIEMLGYSKEEQIGKTSKEVGIWRNPSERDRIIQFLQKNGFFKDEYIEFNTKSGDEILALWSAETIELGGKKLMLSMIHDITQRVKAETELRELKNNLEIEVQKKTQELRERISELERFHEATIEREFRIKELRDEIERLKRT